MSSPHRRPRKAGSWPSPLTVELVNRQFTTIDDVIVDPVTSIVYHIESRPSERGRCTLVDSVSKVEVVWQSFDVKTHVNTYGKAAASVREGILYFNNARDHRVYRQTLPSRDAIPITPDDAPFRFAFFVPHPVYRDIIFTVMEDHTDPTPRGIITSICYIDTRDSTIHKVVSGSDFYVSPTVNASGTKLAWIEWNHPYMQWQGAQLFTADISFSSDGLLSVDNRQLIAGEPGTNAVFEYAWTPPHYDSNIVLTWDKTPFCEPWIYSQRSKSLRPIFGQPNSIQNDFADPAWTLDDCHLVFLDDSELTLCATIKEGRSNLNFLDLNARELQHIPSPYLEISRLRRVDESTVVFIGTTAQQSASLIKMTIDRSWASPAPSFEVLVSAPEPIVDSSLVPTPHSVKVPKRNGQHTYAHFYAPVNPDYKQLPDEKPPCIVSVHSRPTARTRVGFQWHRTFYTSRGFAWLDIDPTGSSGYGKDYRKRLEGQYGVADVADVLDATEYAALLQLFDQQRMCLRSTSEGSFPALKIFTVHPRAFTAAATHFMIADLASAPRDTDKLTRYYMFTLMGGKPENIPEVYRAMNPLLDADLIEQPILITHCRTSPTFNQAERLVDVLLEKENSRIKYRYFDEMPKSTMFTHVFEEELEFFRYVLVDNYNN